MKHANAAGGSLCPVNYNRIIGNRYVDIIFGFIPTIVYDKTKWKEQNILLFVISTKDECNIIYVPLYLPVNDIGVRVLLTII